MTTRRQFLAAAATGIAGSAFLASASAKADGAIVVGLNSSPDAGPGHALGYKGRILALGNLGYFRPDIGSKDVLGVLDLEAGSWDLRAAGTTGGHLAMGLSNGGAVLMPRHHGKIEILGPDLTSKGLVEHDAMAFSGHCIEWNGSLWLGAEPLALAAEGGARDGESADGFLVEIDPVTMRFGRKIGSGGIHPHDMTALGDGLVAVSHYGVTWPAQYGEGGGEHRLMFGPLAPCVTVIDLKSGSVKARIAQPADGAATHVTLGGDGRLYLLPLQYDLVAKEEEFSHIVPGGVTLRQDEWKNLRFAQGLPLRAVDLATGAHQDIDLGPTLQRRGQSIAANKATGRIFCSFTYSDTLLVHDPKTGATEARRAFDFGIHAIRGVCDIPGTEWIAVSGEWEGVVILDARTLQIVGRYAMPTMWCVHISTASRSS